MVTPSRTGDMDSLPTATDPVSAGRDAPESLPPRPPGVPCPDSDLPDEVFSVSPVPLSSVGVVQFSAAAVAAFACVCSSTSFLKAQVAQFP